MAVQSNLLLKGHIQHTELILNERTSNSVQVAAAAQINKLVRENLRTHYLQLCLLYKYADFLLVPHPCSCTKSEGYSVGTN